MTSRDAARPGGAGLLQIPFEVFPGVVRHAQDNPRYGVDDSRLIVVSGRNPMAQQRDEFWAHRIFSSGI